MIETDEETKQKIRETITARRMKVISRENDYYVVVWLDRDKTKYGQLDLDYTHRYGVRVLATYDTDNNRFYFKSNDIAASIPDEHLQYMRDIDAGKHTKLKDLDISTIEVSW